MTDLQPERGDQLEQLLKSSAQPFDPGFADRVMDRIEHEPTLRLDLAAVMVRQFRVLAPIGLAAGLALAVFNVTQADESGQTLAEAAFGVDPISVDGLYTISVPGVTDEVDS
jgi:hypothetical protein